MCNYGTILELQKPISTISNSNVFKDKKYLLLKVDVQMFYDFVCYLNNVTIIELLDQCTYTNKSKQEVVPHRGIEFANQQMCLGFVGS